MYSIGQPLPRPTPPPLEIASLVPVYRQWRFYLWLPLGARVFGLSSNKAGKGVGAMKGELTLLSPTRQRKVYRDVYSPEHLCPTCVVIDW